MAILKCKMCGGDMEVSADKTFGTCEYCGSTMTLPRTMEDEQRAAAFNRGNHFRRACDFDKALAVYERIVAEDDTDAEAHWCCALCRFGIEYVEDPATMEYIPTCHRASFDSFLEDVDYQAAVEHSDGLTRRQYQKDAAKIAEVQRGILATSQTTEPFDVFICYKETGENGQRTLDSVRAQEIYYQLTEAGYRVFFSRITLEDIVGSQYEPYIFAALNSAKVMVVVGTKAEHFGAVWVKNEWSRFLAMMKKDHSKLLLPCYQSMDPYDLPEQLSVLQSYDISKIGFVQDLIRGIAKVIDAGKQTEQPVHTEAVVVQQNTAVGSPDPLLKRAFMFLEDGDWKSADEYCEKVLDIDPENARAYLGKFMAEMHVHQQEDLKGSAKPFDDHNLFQKVIRFGDKELRKTLNGYIEFINTRNEIARLDSIYSRAEAAINIAAAGELHKAEENYKEAAELFETISGYKDSADRAEDCYELAEVARKDAILAEAEANMSRWDVSKYEAAIKLLKTISGWKNADELILTCQNRIEEIQIRVEAARKDNILAEAKKNMAGGLILQHNAAIKMLESIPGWKDADECLSVCRKKVAELEAAHERQAKVARKKSAANTVVSVLVVVAAIVFFILLNKVIIPESNYKAAVALMDAENYVDAISAFRELDGYKDSTDRIIEIIRITGSNNVNR